LGGVVGALGFTTPPEAILASWREKGAFHENGGLADVTQEAVIFPAFPPCSGGEDLDSREQASSDAQRLIIHTKYRGTECRGVWDKLQIRDDQGKGSQKITHGIWANHD